MAKAKKKATKRSTCKGINKKTGKIKPGYKPVKGGCPRKVSKKKSKKK